jgi:transposase-like protein
MITSAKSIYRGYRFPAEVIQQAVWLYFRFPLSLRMVEDLLAARGIIVSHETVRLSLTPTKLKGPLRDVSSAPGAVARGCS